MCMVCLSSAHGQQRAQFSQYMANYYLLNPAVAGTEKFIDVKAGFRSQWVGFEGGPVTYYVSAHSALGHHGKDYTHHKGYKKGWNGVGGYLFNDITGPTSRLGGQMSYSYNIPLYRHTRMSLGVSAGFQQYALDGSDFVLVNYNDKTLPQNRVTSLLPDASIGAWVYSMRWYAGVSIHQILQSEVDFGNNAIAKTNGVDISKLNNHYFLTAGVYLPINADIEMVPSFTVKAVNPAPISVDLNAKISYQKELYWMGLSYRSLDSFTLMIGTTIKNRLGISYSFDLTTSELRKFNTGSNEIVISYKIPPHGSIDCPSQYWR